MDGLSGFEVLQWVRSQPQFQNLVVIMVSASRQERDVEQAARLGANSFVAKLADFRLLTKLLLSIQNYWLRFHEFGWDASCRPKDT